VDGGTGGQVQFSNLKTSGKRLNIQSLPPVGAYDLAYRTPDEIWVGGGNLLCSFDGGKTWEKDREVEDVPSIFIRLFFTPEQGFIIGPAFCSNIKLRLKRLDEGSGSEKNRKKSLCKERFDCF